jgi:predicted O-methyltransferase YrrM
MPRFGDALTAAARLARALREEPVETAIAMRDVAAERAEHKNGGFMPWPPCPYEEDEDWEVALHDLVGAPWPCPAIDEFSARWSQVIEQLTSSGMALGRGAFAGWGDGEAGFVRAVWCITRHVRPAKVVETGVARGMTSRFILEALTAIGEGRLWSIDLPPPGRPDVRGLIGVAVPDALHSRWSYVQGSSRRRLPALLALLAEIDLFVHDSRHSERNVLYELERARAAVRPGGFLIADDVDLNCGLHRYREKHAEDRVLVCPAEPLRPDPGRQNDRGVFAVIAKGG